MSLPPFTDVDLDFSGETDPRNDPHFDPNDRDRHYKNNGFYRETSMYDLDRMDRSLGSMDGVNRSDSLDGDANNNNNNNNNNSTANTTTNNSSSNSNNNSSSNINNALLLDARMTTHSNTHEIGVESLPFSTQQQIEEERLRGDILRYTLHHPSPP